MVEDRYPFRAPFMAKTGTLQGHRSPGLTSLSPIGVLGGTFDPIHFAHLRLAEEFADGIGLSKVRFIPTGTPPHRGTPRVAGSQRMEMVRLAIAGNPRFEVDDREIRRQGICYTFDTLTELRAELGERPLCLLMGSDAFFRADHVASLGGVVRPGAYRDRAPAGLFPAAIAVFPAGSAAQDLPAAAGFLDRPLAPGRRRRHIRQGNHRAGHCRDPDPGLLAGGGSARYLVPDAVLDYIEANRLYKERDAR